MYKCVMEYVRAYGLEIHIAPYLEHWRLTITWERPPWAQVMAQNSRALIVFTEGMSPTDCINKAALDLQKWFEKNKDIERIKHEQN